MKKWLLILIIILASGKISPNITGSLEFAGEDIFELLLTLIFAGITIRYFDNRLIYKEDRRLIIFVVLIAALVSVSVFWSNDPVRTVMRSLLLINSVLAVYCISKRITLKMLLSALFIALSIIVVLSMMVCIFVPHIGIATENHETAWNGIYGQKNPLGRVTALAFLISMGRFIYERDLTVEQKTGMVLTTICSVIVLIKSESKTGLAVSMAILMMIYFLRFKMFRRVVVSNTHYIFLAIAIIGIIAIAQNFRTLIYMQVDEDKSLTGRVPIWLACLPFLAKHLFFGWGFGGFWVDDAYPSEYIWQIVGWQPHDSHSGFFDFTMDTGLVGISLVIVFLFAIIKRRISVFGRGRLPLEASQVYFYNLAITTFVIFYNFTESALIRPSNLLWILLLTLVFQNASKNTVFIKEGKMKLNTTNLLPAV